MKTLKIINEIFSQISSEIYEKCENSFDICQNLKNNEYANYYNMIIFKSNNICYAAYRDDLENYFRI